MQSSSATAVINAGESVQPTGRIPLIGDKFPRVEVQTTHGKVTLPDVFDGKWFVLFSHPADLTPVCTTEFVAFAKRHGQFKELNSGSSGCPLTKWYHT